MARFSIDSVEIHGVGMASAVAFRAVGDVELDFGHNVITPDSGDAYDEVAFLSEAQVAGKLSAKAIASLLGIIPIIGTKCITADGTHPGVRLYGQLHDPCGTAGRGSGSVNLRVTLAKCWLALERIAGTGSQSATAGVRIIGGSTDGDVAPDDIAYNAALPATPIVDEEFVIAEPTLRTGVTIARDQCQGWTYESGTRISPKIGLGSIYVTGIDVEKVQPKFTIEHDDPTLVDPAKVPKRGVKVPIAETRFPLVRRDPATGTLVARTELQHIAITAEGFLYPTRHFSGGGPTPVTGQLMLNCTKPTSGAPVQDDLAAALA